MTLFNSTNRIAPQNKYALKIQIQIQSQLFNSYADYHSCAKSLKRNDCFSIIGTFFSYIKCTAPKFPFLWFLSAHQNREPCKNMLFNVQHQLSKLISMQMSSRFKWVFLIQLSLWHSLEILNKGSLVKPHYKRCRPYLGIFGGNWHKNTAYLPWRGRSETFCDIRDTLLNVYIRGGKCGEREETHFGSETMGIYHLPQLAFTFSSSSSSLVT